MSKHRHGKTAYVVDRQSDRVIATMGSFAEARRNAVEFNKSANPRRVGGKARYYAESLRSRVAARSTTLGEREG
jgi:hypothetical protein